MAFTPATPDPRAGPRPAAPSASTEATGGIAPDWYEAAFGRDYLRVYRRRDAAAANREVEFVERVLALAPGDRVLDLCCGAGRHLAALGAKGLEVVGLDRSRELLGRARDAPAERRLVLADMRDLPFGRAFTAVLSFFSSFGYFFEEHQNQRVLGEISRVLRPGGHFFLDLMNRAHLRSQLVPESERHDGETTIRERRWFSADGNRVEKEIRVTDEKQALQFHESVRLYSRSEVEAALAGAGLGLDGIWGSFDGDPYDAEASPRMLLTGSPRARLTRGG